MFPLANYLKEEVRDIASQQNIPVAQKTESQEICFIPENNYRNFLKKSGVTFQKGFIEDTQGRILSKHEGKENYTVGQRKGLKIATGQPMYVLEIKSNGNIVVGSQNDLNRKHFFATDALFQGLDSFDLHPDGIEVLAQIRYNSEPVPAIIFGDNTESKQGECSRLKVELETPCYAVTPGQSVVFYDKDEKCILAGGKISL